MKEPLTLRRLNADSSWEFCSPSCRIVVDPWFVGVQRDFASWFSSQWMSSYLPGWPGKDRPTYIIVTHPFTDHNHKETLEGLPAEIPVFWVNKLKSGECRVVGDFRIVRYGKRWLHSLFEFEHLPTGMRVGYSPHGFVWNERDPLPRPGMRLWLTSVIDYVLPWWLGGAVSRSSDVLVKGLVELGPEEFSGIHDAEKNASGLVSRVARVRRMPLESLVAIGNTCSSSYIQIEVGENMIL